MYTYIIIDDEELTRIGTKEKLSSITDQALCVGEADNGEKGLRLVQMFHPDIVITDMKMPVLGGEKLLPILAEKYPDIYIIVISGYQDFEYSRQAIRARAVDYILKPFSAEDIICAVKQAISAIQDDSFTADQIRESESYKEALHYAQDTELLQQMIQGYELENMEFTSSRLSFVGINSFLYFILLQSDSLLSEDVIQSFFADHEYNGMCLYLPHKHAANLGFLLLFFPENIPLRSRNLMEHITKELVFFLHAQGENVSCGVSQFHRALSQLHQAYKESIQALNQKTLSDNRALFLSENPTASVSGPGIWPEENRLLFYIESAQTEEVHQLTRELFTFYRTFSQAALETIKFHLLRFTSQLKLMMNFYVPQISPSSRDSSIQNMLDTMFSLTELENYFLQFFTTLATSLQKDNIYSDSDIVVNVKTYIDHNYQKDISVEFVASLFHMNRSYLSHIFKKKQGQSFKDYLNLVRLEHAKSLLKQTNKKIYQIATAVGYDNVRSLYRVFKKMEHTTPEQYRGE